MLKRRKITSKKICEVTPYILEGRILLSFSASWITLLKCIPTFDVFLDEKGRIILISKQKIN